MKWWHIIRWQCKKPFYIDNASKLIHYKSCWLLSLLVFYFLRAIMGLQIIILLYWRALYYYLHHSQQDQFGRLLPTFIQVINFTEQEKSEYWAVVSAVFEGRQVDWITSRSKFDLVASTSVEAGIDNKVFVNHLTSLLHAVCKWELLIFV